MLQYVQLTVTSEDKVTLTLVYNEQNYKKCQPNLSYFLKALKEGKEGEIFESVWLNCNDGNGNVIFKRDAWTKLQGRGKRRICLI